MEAPSISKSNKGIERNSIHIIEVDVIQTIFLVFRKNGIKPIGNYVGSTQSILKYHEKRIRVL